MRLGVRRTATVAVSLSVWVASAGPATGQPVPPPTPVPPAGSPSPYPTALETPVPSAEPPAVTAESAALGDLVSGEILWQRKGALQQPIASVTKIMTALLVLETTDPGELVTASANAASQSGAELGLKAGEQLPVRDLLLALMLQSANDAAVALAEHVSGDVETFVGGMNRRARELGLGNTRFASPNGLDDSGYSTARDLIALTAEAYRKPSFGRVVSTKFHRIPSPDGEARRIQNRNALLWLYAGAEGVKTGYTAAAGFCLVASAERDGLRLVSVALGSPDEAFTDAATILDHGFAAYEHRAVITEGQRLDPISVDGRQVPIRAGGGLEVLIPRGQPVALEVRPAAGLGLPIDAGETVGLVEAPTGGVSLGQASVVAAGTVRLAPPVVEEDEPWWERALEAVGRFFSRVFRAIFG
jgi:serine-type D-Ala-D-Ala carboxypeptidase (penicillin-binding protein 5/6)